MSAEYNLSKLLEQNFNEDELRFLCAELDISYESLSGDNKKRKALEIVGYLQRRDQLDVLISKVAKERPHLQPQLSAIKIEPPSNSNKTNLVNIPTHTSDPIKSRLFVLIAVAISVFLLIILGAWGVSSLFSTEPTDTAVPTDRFTYQVRVQENGSNQPIENANVTISLPGTTPVNEFTDSTGLAVFRIDNQFADKLVVLHITKDGFEDWDQNITIKADEQPQKIKLEKVP